MFKLKRREWLSGLLATLGGAALEGRSGTVQENSTGAVILDMSNSLPSMKPSGARGAFRMPLVNHLGYRPHGAKHLVVEDLPTAREARVVNLKEPEKSLLLVKPSFQIPHGGGEVLPEGSPEYNTFLRWLGAGAKRDAASERRMVALRVLPPSLVLTARAPSGSSSLRRAIPMTPRLMLRIKSSISRTTTIWSRSGATVS